MATRKKADAKPAPAKPYSLMIRFAPDERKMLEALEQDTKLRRTALIRHLLADEAKRRGL